MSKATRPDSTSTQDADHNYKMVFRLFAGNQKELTRYFATPEDAEKFEARNSIVVINRTRKDS